MISQDTKLRRLRRVRGKLKTNINLPRLSVYRSNKNIWAQIIDDKTNKTLAAVSSKAVKEKATKTKIASTVGELIADKALELKIKMVRFDRGLYRYHGRVKALAQAARDKGLRF